MSRLNVDVIASGDPGWDEQLEGVSHDVYHRAGYHRFAEVSGDGTAFMTVIRESRGGRGLLKAVCQHAHGRPSPLSARP